MTTPRTYVSPWDRKDRKANPALSNYTDNRLLPFDIPGALNILKESVDRTIEKMSLSDGPLGLPSPLNALQIIGNFPYTVNKLLNKR